MRIGSSPRLLFTLIVIGISSSICIAQQFTADTAFVRAAKNKVISTYTLAIEHQSRLYNGGDYVMYISHDGEHPYYREDDWAFGTITYWNEAYANVPLMYDLSTDDVITEHMRGNQIRLLPYKIQGFTMHGHQFVRLTKANGIQEGFYRVLHDGKTKVYSKYIKEYREKLETKQVIPLFREITRYYIKKDSTYFPVKNKASVIKTFADQKNEVKNFIRKNGIKFTNNREQALARIASFYDSIKD